MSLIASLYDFSFPEILQFIEKGRKTGLLTIHTEPVSQASQSSIHYIWVYQGRIVAVAKRLDGQGLVKLIEQRKWVSKRVLNKLIHWCCPHNEPLGQSLNNQGILRIEQLKELFYFQVLQPVLNLFKLKDGVFKFDPNAPLPMREMTGLSISAGVLKHYLLTPEKLPRQTKLFSDKTGWQIKGDRDTIKRFFRHCWLITVQTPKSGKRLAMDERTALIKAKLKTKIKRIFPYHRRQNLLTKNAH
jgi:hypothetical protein